MPQENNHHNIECSGKEWRKIREEKKADKRKWKEEKVIKRLEREKRMRLEEENRRMLPEQDHERHKELGRLYTISIAVPGSILDNAQTAELRTYLAGQIARAAAVFNVDEIIIFDETGKQTSESEGNFKGMRKKGDGNIQMARVLQYLECPQYLRKQFFPQHPDLKYAGLLNPLDSPHHMRAEEIIPYREGVVLQKPVKNGKGSFVDVGLNNKEVQIDKQLQPKLRVTVKMPENADAYDQKSVKGCRVVAPSSPRTDSGLYWGYSVRLAKSLGAIFTECPFKGGYDLLVGTSEKGSSVDTCVLPKFEHAVIVFGGVQGLEASLDADHDLKVEDPRLLFQQYLNTCPDQGSHTIRTEEAILISLSSLRPKILEATSKLGTTSEASAAPC